MQELKGLKEELSTDINRSNASLNKQVQDIYGQMRKLSADLFDSVKSAKPGDGGMNFTADKMERDKEMLR